jgi:hypothetical protein
MKQIKLFFYRMFNRRQPVYGERIFQQRSWLSKQVEEAMWNRSRGIR